MRIRKKYISFLSGFIRFKSFEINYSLLYWALPFSMEFSKHLIFLRILCISIIINK